MNVESYIGEVGEHLQNLLNDIINITTEHNNTELFKKILLITYIESLASTRYKNTIESPRTRFTKLISEYSNWQEHKLICPLHLNRFADNQSELTKLRDFTQKYLDDWSSSYSKKAIIYFGESPSLDKIKTMWPNKGKQKCAKTLPEFFSYANLLYGARNQLVHQQAGTHGVFGQANQKPHYYAWPKIEGAKSLEVVFPSLFLQCLCQTLLDGVIAYFRYVKEDPWPEGHFNTLLIE